MMVQTDQNMSQNKWSDIYTHMCTLIVVIYSIQFALLNVQTVKNKQQE